MNKYANAEKGLMLRLFATLYGMEPPNFATVIPRDGLSCETFNDYWYTIPIEEMEQIAIEARDEHYPHECPQYYGAIKYLEWLDAMNLAQVELDTL